MNQPMIIGSQDPSITYTDRPTVKVLILNENNEVLIINNGLLPGGGVEAGEDEITALNREVIEELGVTISDIEELGTVIQYRNLLSKKYIISGYVAQFVDSSENPSPQDKGEAQFKYDWYSIDDAKALLDASIVEVEASEYALDDAYQGKLFNLMTTRVLLNTLNENGIKISYKFSAGGIVVRGGKILTIYSPSKGTAGLPKGKIDPGETQETTAIREVKEETGYSVEIVEKLGDYTYEFVWTDGEQYRKTVSYFLMKLIEDEPSSQNLQHDEDFEVRWLTIPQALEQLTYPDSKDAVKRVMKRDTMS